ncbi:MAG: acetate--CoA ligase [Rickettsiales bacterium]|nr:acetate--CoA ligase [Rickettsiales bacterium]
MTFRISSLEQYKTEYSRSIQDPQGFWGDIAKNFRWFKNWDQVMDCDFSNMQIEWFKGGTTNISYNCLDRHLIEDDCDEAIKDKIAIIFEPNNPQEETRKITYRQLYEKVLQFSNLLIAQGVVVGDRVCIYMPMIPEAAVAMLACARIGAIHSVVFAGFSAKALASRMQDSQVKILITADLLFRGDKKIQLFDIAAEALAECPSVERVIVYKRAKEDLPVDSKILIWQDEINKYEADAPHYEADAEHPLFILYTSGSTGKPKGIVHSHGGYMVYAAYSFCNVFQYHNGDIFFCSADIGWITGHSYLIYGPLLNGATTLMFEGVPTYPTPARFWEIIEKHQVSIFYTAPTAIRALMQKGDQFAEGHNLQSLKTLGTVGEPINQEAWQWYHDKIGAAKCPIVDTWWQTETGGIMISALSGITESRATYAGLPLCGIEPILLDDDGHEITESNKAGNLCFKTPWPSMARAIWGDRQKFYDTYFAHFPGYYFAGDGAFRSEDGLYRIIGRTDDVLKISGHRIGTAEVENAINMHENIAESAAIGFPHQIKGEGICVFVIPKTTPQSKEYLENEIIELIKKEIGSIAKPDKIYIINDLPKTRSGKIMRRVLKKIIAGESDLGDISTLVNPEIVEELKKMIGKEAKAAGE